MDIILQKLQEVSLKVIERSEQQMETARKYDTLCNKLYYTMRKYLDTGNILKEDAEELLQMSQGNYEKGRHFNRE